MASRSSAPSLPNQSARSASPRQNQLRSIPLPNLDSARIGTNSPPASQSISVGNKAAFDKRPATASIQIPFGHQQDLPELQLPAKPLAMPEPGAESPAPVELTTKPIYVEPLFETEAEWREWQLARQRATTKSQQAERDNLTSGLQRFLQQGARVTP